MSSSPSNPTSYTSLYDTSRKRSRQSSEIITNGRSSSSQYTPPPPSSRSSHTPHDTNSALDLLSFHSHHEPNIPTDSNDIDNHHDHNNNLSTLTTTSTSTTQNTAALDEYLSSEISDLKSELEHIQSQRRIDQIRNSNTVSRLQRHVASLEQDAEEARSFAEEVQLRSEEGLERMNATRRQALGKVQELERRLMARGGVGEDNQGLMEENTLLRRNNDMQERRLNAMQDEMDRVKERLQEAQLRLTITRPNTTAQITTPDRSPQHNQNSPPSTNILSPAQPSILKELNKTRLQLSDAERTNRQLNRRHDESHTKLTQLTHYKESTRHAEGKLLLLEPELRNLRREREVLRVVEKRWEEFRYELSDRVPIPIPEVGVGEDGMLRTADENVPPEIAAVVRHVRSLTAKGVTAEEQNMRLQSQYDAGQRRLRLLEGKGEDHDVLAERWRKERGEMEKRLEEVEIDCRTVRSQERVWKREASGMRSLLDTYKAQEESGGDVRQGGERGEFMETGTDNLDDPTIKGLELSLTSAQNEIQILNERVTTTKEQNDQLQKDTETSSEELTRVKTKFGQIRDALMKEREKAEKADDRALRAETLVGKGAFNDECTRVLHLRDNPFATAVRDKFEAEIAALRATLEAKEMELVAGGRGDGAGGDVARITPSATTALDAQKLHQRLKESFREKIGLFREGVYLITGFKIDMIADTDRPQFKVRPMFAEREEDHLMFQWPTKLGGREEVSSLDILDTELAQVLAKEDSFRYMTKFNSLPAFMASVCLTMFETQTMAI